MAYGSLGRPWVMHDLPWDPHCRMSIVNGYNNYWQFLKANISRWKLYTCLNFGWFSSFCHLLFSSKISFLRLTFFLQCITKPILRIRPSIPILVAPIPEVILLIPLFLFWKFYILMCSPTEPYPILVCVCVNPVLFDQTGPSRPRVEEHSVAAAMFLMRSLIVMQEMFLRLLESLAISPNKTLLTFGFISTLQVI